MLPQEHHGPLVCRCAHPRDGTSHPFNTTSRHPMPHSPPVNPLSPHFSPTRARAPDLAARGSPAGCTEGPVLGRPSPPAHSRAPRSSHGSGRPRHPRAVGRAAGARSDAWAPSGRDLPSAARVRPAGARRPGERAKRAWAGEGRAAEDAARSTRAAGERVRRGRRRGLRGGTGAQMGSMEPAVATSQRPALGGAGGAVERRAASAGRRSSLRALHDAAGRHHVVPCVGRRRG